MTAGQMSGDIRGRKDDRRAIAVHQGGAAALLRAGW
jgi:hypothetical protein